MKIAVNIKVRNPEWYWPKERMSDSKNKDSMSRKEWEMLNEDKIPKHSAEVDFEYNFDVISYKDNRNSKFGITLFKTNNETTNNPLPVTFTLHDVTVVEFDGGLEKSYVVVSNELIHQFISARQNRNGRFYWYFYLKENSEYVKLTNNIWVSYVQFNKITEQFNRFAIKRDPNLELRKLSGLFQAQPLLEDTDE